MSNYFSYFPKTKHDLTNIGQTVDLTNILRRFKVKSSVKSGINVYFDYEIQEGDRPDTIAEKYYGSPAYAWLVLHFNDIIDPVFEWPLFSNDFENYLKGKYGSITTSQSTVHEYRQILNEAKVLNNGTRIPKRWVVVDLTTYSTLAEVDKESISKYDYEIEKNEVKRKVKVLDKKYLTQVQEEVKGILRNGI
jgi:hypothetical protein